MVTDETPQEHVRNALQLLSVPIVRLRDFQIAGHSLDGEVVIYFAETFDAALDRLRRAVEILERKGS